MSSARPRPPIEPDLLALVAAGGAAGALLRHAVEVLAPASGPGSFPWPTFAINVAGAFGLGLLHAYVPAHPRLPRRVRALLGVGLLGGFTTFSTYSEQTRALLAAGQDLAAFLYLVGTLLAAVLAVDGARRLVPLATRRRRR
jgi:fluoride exporter